MGRGRAQAAETPALLKTPAGYVQASPWIGIANKQLELMAKFMAELGLTPSSRSRLAIQVPTRPKPWETAGVYEVDEDDLLARAVEVIALPFAGDPSRDR